MKEVLNYPCISEIFTEKIIKWDTLGLIIKNLIYIFDKSILKEIHTHMREVGRWRGNGNKQHSFKDQPCKSDSFSFSLFISILSLIPYRQSHLYPTGNHMKVNCPTDSQKFRAENKEGKRYFLFYSFFWEF